MPRMMRHMDLASVAVAEHYRLAIREVVEVDGPGSGQEAWEALGAEPDCPEAETSRRPASLREDLEEWEAAIVGFQSCLRGFGGIEGYRAAKSPSLALALAQSLWPCMMHYRTCATLHHHLPVYSFRRIA